MTVSSSTQIHVSPPSSLRLQMLLCFAVFVLAVVSAVILHVHGSQSRKFLPSSGTPVSATTVRTPVEAYQLWQKQGVKGRIVLYVGERWSRLVPPNVSLPVEYAAYPVTAVNPADIIERDQLSNETFLYVASRTGIARRIDALLSPDGFDEMRATALASRNSSVGEENFFVSSTGFPRHFYLPKSLRPQKEPVLLYLGASWFRKGDPGALAAAFRAAGVRGDSIVLCLEENDPTVTQKEREALLRFAAGWGGQ